MLLILLGLNSCIVAYLILIGLVPPALPGHLLGGSDIQLRHHPHSMDLGHREAARPGNSTAETTTSTRLQRRDAVRPGDVYEVVDEAQQDSPELYEVPRVTVVKCCEACYTVKNQAPSLCF